MTLDECTELLTPLALAMRVQMGVPSFKAYHAILANIPFVVAQAGLDQLAQTGLRFFPTAPEIQAAAEKARRQLLALHAWEPCCECEDSPRWRTVEIDGVQRLERCPCVKRHENLLADKGLLTPIALLPGEADLRDDPTAYPTVEQIPTGIRAQLAQISERKLIR